MNKLSECKIVLIGDTLGEGGAERVQARLSILFDSKGINVHHVIVRNVIKYDYAGTLFNMGLLKSEINTFGNRIFRLYELNKYLAKHQFDYIIDFRVKNNFFQEFILANIIYKLPYVMSIRSFDTNYYFPKNKFLAKLIYKKALGIITVSKALERKIKREYGYKNVTTIYNPIEKKDDILHLDLDYQFIFGMGRMKTNIKQFDHLIKAYKKSDSRNHNIKLLLAGDGDNKKELELLVEKEGLTEDVEFLGHLENPEAYLKRAYFTALTSKNEGFPNVLLESLVYSTPVVAYECESGPNEIIMDTHNGLLVKNQDIDAFAIAINKMITDKDLYVNCKLNAKSSVDKFNPEAIVNKWIKFLKIEQKSL
ncbi:MAG: glycosyltransferase [Flavobacteriaceae bacterium]|jgi:glycosyltransferase involved in cell wall biosynthesis|nr:glycosyltransferase [Flavobacteriaceae bacterium]